MTAFMEAIPACAIMALFILSSCAIFLGLEHRK